MRFNSRRPRAGKALCALFGGLALAAGSQAAFAQSEAHPAVGVLTLPNVRIQSATPGQIAQAQQVTQSGDAAFRAYKDPVTGELRDQTPEEAMAQGIVRSTKRSVTAKSATVSPHGGISIPLDDTHMVDAVVTKDADGKVNMQCVTGPDAAAHALTHGTAGKGHNHDR